MDWIHCNSCFVQPRSNSNPPKFFLTSCGHIFCERCNDSGGSGSKCRVCEASYTTTLLSSQLREEVRDFFADPMEIFSKAMKVQQYQNTHRERLTSYLRRSVIKYEAAKKEIAKVHEEMKSLRKKIHALQQEVAWYKLQRDRMRSRMAPVTPAGSSLPPTSPFNGLSPARSDTLRGSQQMRSSGMGNSRISMGFTSSGTPNRSPLDMLSMNTPFNPGNYRSSQQGFNTPESTPSRLSPAFTSSTRSGFLSSSQDMRRPQPTPPSRGTPTDALKILSLAYKNNAN